MKRRCRECGELKEEFKREGVCNDCDEGNKHVPECPECGSTDVALKEEEPDASFVYPVGEIRSWECNKCGFRSGHHLDWNWVFDTNEEE